MNAIEVNELTKTYRQRGKNIAALNKVSLSVPKGMIFGLLGPNGAGKTTMIKILLGIVHISSGSAKLLDSDVSDYTVRRRIGYLPENHKFPIFLSGRQTLEYSARLSGMDLTGLDNKISDLLKIVNMEKWADTKIKKYSKGMLQRIGLAQALVNDPEVVFLDEPTDGVDPIGRKEIRDVMIRLKDEGKTIFLNSHLLSEIELVTDRIAILNKGKLIREGNVNDLTVKGEIYSINLITKASEIFGIEGINMKTTGERSIEVYLESGEDINSVIDKLRANDVKIESFAPLKQSLEDLFVNLIEESEKEAE